MLHQSIVVEGAARNKTRIPMSHSSGSRAETHANGGSQRVTRLEGVTGCQSISPHEYPGSILLLYML